MIIWISNFEEWIVESLDIRLFQWFNAISTHAALTCSEIVSRKIIVPIPYTAFPPNMLDIVYKFVFNSRCQDWFFFSAYFFGFESIRFISDLKSYVLFVR